MLLYHVLTQPHVPRSLLLRTPISISAPPPYLRTPLVFKPCIFFDTNQSDYCIHSSSYILLIWLHSPHISLYPLLQLILCLQTSAWLRSLTSCWSYRTYPLTQLDLESNVYSGFGLRCKTPLCFEDNFALGLSHSQYGYNLNRGSNSPCDHLLRHAIPWSRSTSIFRLYVPHRTLLQV